MYHQAVFSILGNFYILITSSFAPAGYNRWVQLVFEVLSWIFWLSAFCAAGATTAVTAVSFVGVDYWSTNKFFIAWITAVVSGVVGFIIWYV